NLRPRPCKGRALPAELSARALSFCDLRRTVKFRAVDGRANVPAGLPRCILKMGRTHDAAAVKYSTRRVARQLHRRAASYALPASFIVTRRRRRATRAFILYR